MRATMIAALMLLSGAAQAVVTMTYTRSTWDALIAGAPVTELDYEEFASGTPLALQHIPEGVRYPGPPQPSVVYVSIPQFPFLAAAAQVSGPLKIEFLAPQIGVAIKIRPGPYNTLPRLFNDGVEIPFTPTLPCTLAPGVSFLYCYVHSDEPFDEAWWAPQGGTISQADDILFAAAPGPAPEVTCKPNRAPIVGLLLQGDPLALTGIAVPEPGDVCLTYEEVAPGSIVEGGYLEFVIGDR